MANPVDVSGVPSERQSAALVELNQLSGFGSHWTRAYDPRAVVWINGNSFRDERWHSGKRRASAVNHDISGRASNQLDWVFSPVPHM